MMNYCTFSKDHKCIKWMDYELIRHELEKPMNCVMATG